MPTSGPSSASSGTQVIATNLSGTYPDGLNYATSYAQTPAFPVNGPSPTLSFMMWLETESCCDGLHVEISTDGTTWSLLSTVLPAYSSSSIGGQPAWNGARTTWSQYTADLSAYVGQQARLRFSFRSDGSVVRPGAYIDEVQVLPSAGSLPVVLAPATFPEQVLPPEMVSIQLSTTSPGAVAWEIADETNAAWLSVSQTGLLTGDSSLAAPGPASVTVRAYRSDNPSVFDEVTFDFAVVESFYSEVFEPCPAEWAYTGDWECGDPTSGPAATHSGTNAVGTSTYSNSRAWGSSTATSAEIDLTGTVNPQLRFWFWQDSEPGWDCTRLLISADGGAYTQLATSLPYAGNEGGQDCWDDDYTTWTLVTADLSAYAGQAIRLQWSHYSDSSGTYPGPFVDDLAILTE